MRLLIRMLMAASVIVAGFGLRYTARTTSAGPSGAAATGELPVAELPAAGMPRLRPQTGLHRLLLHISLR